MVTREAAQSPHWRALTCPSTVLLLLVLGGLLLGTRWLKVNVQPSVPYGLYRVVALPARLERGMLALLPPPAVTYPWHVWWLALAKPIAAIQGDQVCILSAGLWINGEPYGVVYQEAYGKGLPRLRGCFAVPEGKVFVASKNARSLDSRYFGPITITDLRARLVPLWTW